MNYWAMVPGFNNKVRASINGEIQKYYKTCGWKTVSQYWKTKKGRGKHCKINQKEYNAARLIWSAFNGPIPDGYIVAHKDGVNIINALECLYLTTLKENAKITGGMCADRRVEKIDPAGNLIKTYRSAREAAKYEYMSRQSITDRCNGKIKNEFSYGYSYRWQN